MRLNIRIFPSIYLFIQELRSPEMDIETMSVRSDESGESSMWESEVKIFFISYSARQLETCRNCNVGSKGDRQ